MCVAESCLYTYCVDYFTVRKERGALERQGLFPHVATPFVSSHCLDGCVRHVLPVAMLDGATSQKMFGQHLLKEWDYE